MHTTYAFQCLCVCCADLVWNVSAKQTVCFFVISPCNTISMCIPIWFSISETDFETILNWRDSIEHIIDWTLWRENVFHRFVIPTSRRVSFYVTKRYLVFINGNECRTFCFARSNQYVYIGNENNVQFDDQWVITNLLFTYFFIVSRGARLPFKLWNTVIYKL